MICFRVEKKSECASRVQSVRAVLQGRATKLAVVLIQVRAGARGNCSEGSTIGKVVLMNEILKNGFTMAGS